MKCRLIGTVAASLVLMGSLPANAALQSRLGGLAYYDTAANLTWLANANAAVGSAYDTYSPGTGLMNWSDANAWATNLKVDGVTGWRLPDTNPINGSSYNYTLAYDGSTDYGYNVSASGTTYAGSMGSEIAYLFYNTLGNKAYYDTSGNPQAGYGLTNTGPFSNVQSYAYWSATEYAPNPIIAWYFDMRDGGQYDYGYKTTSFYAWAVHTGDVGLLTTVPLPASVYLFGTGLVGMGWISRRKKARSE